MQQGEPQIFFYVANHKNYLVTSYTIFSCGNLHLQGEELNEYGELYIKKHRNLRINLVDGSSLAIAIVLKSIPKGTTQVVLCGNLNKVGFAIANALCQSGVQVLMFEE